MFRFGLIRSAWRSLCNEACSTPYSSGRAGSGVWIATALLLAAFPLAAKDWPQFRGPSRDGVWRESGLIKSIPTNGLSITWRAPVGYGWASPVIAHGYVYLFDAQLEKPLARERLLCFNETTGKVEWIFDYEVAYPEFAYVPGQGNGPTATPIVDGKRVYIVGAMGNVHCLDARNGKLLWMKNLTQEYKVAEMSSRPSPLIEGNLLILFVGGKPGASVIAVDKKSGKEIWKALSEPVSNSSPLIVPAGGKRQLIVWTGESVTSLDVKTGKVYWREPMVTSNNDAIPTPVLQKHRLLIGGLMLELNPKQPEATVRWPESRVVTRRILSNTSTAMIQGEHVYSAKSGGELVCLEAATGKLVWSTNTVTTLKSGASIHLTPTLTPDVTFLFNERGELICARLTPEGYYESGRGLLVAPTVPFGGRNCAWAPPAFANRHVFARTDKELVCASLRAESGSRK
jgi:outer membrane protein assembly factor BamB